MSGFDIHFESLPLEQLQDARCVTFGNYGRVVGIRGIQKMANKFVKCMLTPLGSDPSDPTYGTTLADSFLGNVDPGSIFAVAAQSVTQAVEKVQQYDSLSGVPDDERLLSADIQNINLDESGFGILLTVSLTNVKGTTVQTLMTSYHVS